MCVVGLSFPTTGMQLNLNGYYGIKHLFKYEWMRNLAIFTSLLFFHIYITFSGHKDIILSPPCALV